MIKAMGAGLRNVEGIRLGKELSVGFTDESGDPLETLRGLSGISTNGSC